MRSKIRIAMFVVLLIAATGIITASSFTTATLTRDTNINVVSDTNGVIALSDELSGDVIREDSTSGELKIDFTVGSATGVNVDSTYELGNPNNPGTSPGFNITNQDGVAHTISIDYTVTSGDGVGDGSNSTEFQVYDSTGSNVVTISEEDSGATFNAGSGATFAVVVVVDTTMAGVDKADDLSGTLNVTAT